MSKKKHPIIFIVEDNKAYNKIVEHHLNLNGYPNTYPFASGEEALKQLYLKPNIIIQDYKLQGMSGLNVLQRVKKVLPNTEFIFLSGQDNIEIAVNTVKYGAFDYILKTETALQRLIQKIDTITNFQQLKRSKQKYFIAAYIFLAILVILLFLIIFTTQMSR